MGGSVKLAVGVVVIGLLAMVGFKFVAPMFEDSSMRDTSDARSSRGKLVIGVDNWIGYFPLCSPEMRKRMRQSGYQLQCLDDSADYASRMAELSKGRLQFAVATVDSYIVNGRDENYPATIISVIDESKGGDAIVAWEAKAKNLDALKSGGALKVAYTKDSPSEHLLKSSAVHFDIPMLKQNRGGWQIHTNGSEDALSRLLKKEADVAVLWEPDVTRALAREGIIKLLGTEDTNKLIVDVLLVNRKFSVEKPEAVVTLLRNYYLTLKFYRANSAQMLSDAASYSELDEGQLKTLLKGVSWANLSDNASSWFGVSKTGGLGSEGLIDAIEGATQILLDSGDFASNPIPDEDPYRITNSHFVSDLYNHGATNVQFGRANPSSDVAQTVNPLERKFSPISEGAWDLLREIGTLKIRPILFQSGTFLLTLDGKGELDKAVKNLEYYPNFRVVIKGHTGVRGDREENRLLSRSRAEAVARYLNVTYGIDSNRMRVLGLGSEQPLARQPGESTRAYSYRLPRVELFLVTEDI